MKNVEDCKRCGARLFELCREDECYRHEDGESVLRLLLIALVLTFAALCLVLWSFPHAVS